MVSVTPSSHLHLWILIDFYSLIPKTNNIDCLLSLRMIHINILFNCICMFNFVFKRILLHCNVYGYIMLYYYVYNVHTGIRGVRVFPSLKSDFISPTMWSIKCKWLVFNILSLNYILCLVLIYQYSTAHDMPFFLYITHHPCGTMYAFLANFYGLNLSFSFLLHFFFGSFSYGRFIMHIWLSLYDGTS